MNIDKEKFDLIYKNLDKESCVAILVHKFPDPDCIGAAAGFAILLKEVYGLDSKTYYNGEVSHPQNRTLKNILHISLDKGESFNPEQHSSVVVLDTDLTNTGFKDIVQNVDVRIDHHLIEREDEPKFKDVRNCGSACAMIWEYLDAFEVSLENYPEIATALVFGIKTDTLDFTRASTTSVDIDAFRSLLPFVDQVALSKVINFPLPKNTFELEAKAYRNKEIINTTLVSFVGEITQHNRDVVPSISDRFSRMDGINTAIILAILDNNIIASVRSTDSRVDVDEACASIFGRKNGGGEGEKGGAEMPLGIAYELIQNEESRAVMMQEVIAGLNAKIFSTLGEQHEEETK